MTALILELGTEELPPTALTSLSTAFHNGILQGLANAGLTSGKGDALEGKAFASPRRLAIFVEDITNKAADSENEKLGPNIKAAFDSEGQPSKAALGFAKSCGVEFTDLQRTETPKGERLVWRSMIEGQSIDIVLQKVLAEVLAGLPIPKRMRWGARRDEFIRPVKWLLAVHGKRTMELSCFGVTAGSNSRGHRFMGDHAGKDNRNEIAIDEASRYSTILEQQGYVIADYEQRKTIIEKQLLQCGKQLGGEVVVGSALLDEVCNLVEWPRCLAGNFDPEFLQLPKEVLISSMRSHQKYFHVVDKNGELMPSFVTVANIDSLDPVEVVAGNERVIRPRLADAQFFYATDNKQALASIADRLSSVVFQDKLGTVADKAGRIEHLAVSIGGQLVGDSAAASTDVQRAAQLCKADLLTDMVGEFADLQGTIGRYYAEANGETASVAAAIEEHYKPRFAGDELPECTEGVWLSLADRLDTLVGIFGIGQPPSGSKDPFALRRAALGLLRIIIEKELNLALRPAIARAIQLHTENGNTLKQEDLEASVLDYILERLRGWYADQGVAFESVQAVLNANLDQPFDIDRRIRAVNEFSKLEEAGALAAANKRVANLLSKQDNAPAVELHADLLKDPAERELAEAIEKLNKEVSPLLAGFDYTGALQKLAQLKQPVDRFFEQVMVMDPDEAIRANRLALLEQLKQLFGQIADISALASG